MRRVVKLARLPHRAYHQGSHSFEKTLGTDTLPATLSPSRNMKETGALKAHLTKCYSCLSPAVPRVNGT